MPNVTTPRAKTRTYEAVTVDTEYGVVRSITTDTVTLKRDQRGVLSATVNDKSVAYAAAEAILNGATRTELLLEVILPIGNAVAHELHWELGRLGHRAHYSLATDVLGVTVVSLAALDADQAATVRSYAYGQMGLATGQRVAA